ncbi:MULTISPECIES: aspartate aminotransferase family protein [Streptomyces]|uniref:Aspartate aminotransferase family protein n=1 Tax=Streptomyces doudnae TaxID=3075536 RepID=A0ABD5EQF0_9ACTN|nr:MULTISPECIES: aspartate aminotransferase family protein [unclassified Streptomyces]MDT0436579.1 aspartate aminotransferase family protein [Streptomyces sp. DSM 41981]MYQ63346.1 aminotransferase class III-fold pyridoxal phosphate-dependent enzyme [Streptomyces sp. SID4950]SCD56368.1 putrescine aminotransferase [Streptomyces sp. SolWspMP-5a-2]
MTAPAAAAAPEVFNRLRRHLSPKLALTGSFAGRGAVEESARGCRVTLSDGRSALDFGSYAVTLLGHRHPAVTAAVREQLETMPTSTRSLANPVTADAAARLSGYLDDRLPKVYFGLGGADVVEVAVKLARLATGRGRVLAVRGGFHGKTLGALALTHSPLYRVGLRGCAVDVVHLDPGDPDAVRRETAAGDVAALVFEPVQGENGAVPLPREVLRQWCEDAHRHGAFAIADEIQCGLRRCGERSVALADRLPVDAVLFGKPLGGGVVPLSALLCSERMYAPLAADPFLHSATFGGHPLSCAALPAALTAIEELAERGAGSAALLDEALTALAARYPGAVVEVRGRGLLRGVEFATPATAGAVVVGLAGAGLLVSPCLGRPTTVRLLPPLVATAAEITEAVGILDAAVAGAAAVTGAG